MEDEEQTGDGSTVSVLHKLSLKLQFASFTWITGSSTGSCSSHTMLNLDTRPLQKGKTRLSAAAADRSRRVSAQLNQKSGTEMMDGGIKKEQKKLNRESSRHDDRTPNDESAAHSLQGSYEGWPDQFYRQRQSLICTEVPLTVFLFSMNFSQRSLTQVNVNL